MQVTLLELVDHLRPRAQAVLVNELVDQQLVGHPLIAPLFAAFADASVQRVGLLNQSPRPQGFGWVPEPAAYFATLRQTNALAVEDVIDEVAVHGVDDERRLDRSRAVSE